MNETPPPGATPLPFAPLVVASQTVQADSDGYFALSVNQDAVINFQPGIEALEFTRINGQSASSFSSSASELSAQNPIFITARSRITQGQLCQAPFNDELHVLFPFTQRYGSSLSVPSGALNYLTSASGAPIPPEEFEPTLPEIVDDSTSFSRPLREFLQPDGTLKVEWYLLGSLAPQQDPLPFCEMRGELGGCSAASLADPNEIFRLAVNSALAMGDAVTKAAKARKIKLRGNFRKAFLMTKVAPELAQLRAHLRSIPRLAFVCSSAPSACVTIKVPKKEINERLESIFRMKWPKEVKPSASSILKVVPGARRDMKRLLDRYPDTVTTCSSR